MAHLNPAQAQSFTDDISSGHSETPGDNDEIQREFKENVSEKCSTRYITRYTEGATGNEGKRR